ncbi:hypothetical protein [Vitiosangium sp. GDMCC 1.1324]|uniref:hypothetical protein n=1 Tax=Vitiosangium sp. (strain GDMCC 1.1324) TaxID=2138576 RepID=UPI00130E36F2|nr:hypothetical protein [Vitiosangium sp. GDMCC 1.1324]
MTKKNVMMVAVLLAGVLGGATAAVAFSRSDMSPCPVDWTCRDSRGRCIPCPEE